MENIPKTFRLFPWQTAAMKSIAKFHANNDSAEMRNAVSHYVLKYCHKALSRDQADLLHFKARGLFERQKKAANVKS